MRNLLLFVHVAGAIFWMGGMAFLVLALRPALLAQEQLAPPARLQLMVAVMRRFFAVVWASIAALLATGVALMLQARGAPTPLGWHVMAGLGILMMLVFGHIYFAGYPQVKRAVAAQAWPVAGAALNRVALLVKVNLGLGWLAIAAVLLWR
jgi:uncharacterized membrane protein